MYIPDWIDDLVDAGIPITIDRNDEIGIYFDLNLQSKSHMWLHQVGDNWFVDMRYNERILIEDWNDLVWAAKGGMHGRDFIHYKWEELLVKEGVLKVDTQTTKSYS